ncbi:hypothetical protein HZ326_28740 [Fusarium oxysporum f. sp. albedinis]|nr:hypothetical protein HZ326_28740 [Fusarium oxysporum f. sp. albedinis]
MSPSTCGRPASIPLSSALPYTFLTMKGNFARFCSACHKSRAVTVAKTLLAELVKSSTNMASKVASGTLSQTTQKATTRALKSSLLSLASISSTTGFDADAFEEDCQADKELQDEMRLWRAKGPIGKLHNIVHWVQRSGQRIDKLHKLQSIENTALGLEDRSTYDVITDNATPWNSSEAMMDRGYQLRNPLDSLVQAEVTEWDHDCRVSGHTEAAKDSHEAFRGKTRRRDGKPIPALIPTPTHGL